MNLFGSASAPNQLRFPSIPGCTIRGDFEGGGLSSDFGALLVSGVDRQIGLTERLSAAIIDTRHPAYIIHSLHDLIKQRIYQIACGYEDGNDCNTLRHDPAFQLGVGHKPFGMDETEGVLASGPTISRLEHAVNGRDIYRISEAIVDQFIAGYATPPAALVLDIDHSEDAVYGQQPLAFYNHHYKSTCYLPLMIFEGVSGALVAAVLRSGRRPTGAENAMILKRVLKRIRAHFPDTQILVRGDGHFSTPELMAMIDAMPHTDFIFGLASNAVINRLAEPLMQSACKLWGDVQTFDVVPDSVRLYDEFDYAANSWSKSWRVVQKAEVMALGENPRFVVTSLEAPTPDCVYEQLYCGRGQAENLIKHLKSDLASDRTSCTTFVANFMRLLEHASAYILHQQLRSQALQHTPLANAQPSTVISKLFKIAVHVKKYKDRVILHLPSSCPFKHLLKTITERLFVPGPARLRLSP
ncbi:MAG: IS1380 family transposase [Anaerolineales bacterium]|nr:IS1380 family transposase [Anaerolineales bacterium]